MSSHTSATSADTFLSRLEEEIRNDGAVRHPFLSRFASEKMALWQLQAFGLQHYQLVRIFVNYMTNLLPRIPDPEAESLFRVVFNDEFGQYTIFRSHPALYRSFLRTLGLSDGAWGRVTPLPEVSRFIEGHLHLTREGDFLEALGAVGPGHEFSIPMMFPPLVAGIKNNTTLTDGDVEYFTLHIEEDKEHAVVFNRLITKFVGTDEGQARLRRGACFSLSLRKAFWDGLNRTLFPVGKGHL